ncbi:adenosylcobinamide-GDP ribazoletransferase [Microvirga sp. W0021]|uniref:Adenosylcobinamide-GDP ribazoletransferase n=1 Tax=Hohaiivirga grylli TaxID=3133970 RepID=A0ABV0BHJ4_9HYPH
MSNKDQTPDQTTPQSKGYLSPIWAVAQCLRFYSRLPIPPLPGEPDPYGAPNFDHMPRALPFAGMLIGLIGALVLCLTSWLFRNDMVAAGLAIAAMTFITGAFHEDGLADTADGFGGGATIERRLVIMKDSLIGSFGASALVLAFIVRVSALAGVSGGLTLLGSATCIVIAAFLSRISALYILVALPSARSDGMSRSVGRTSWPNYISGLVIAWVLALCLGYVCGLPLAGIYLAPLSALLVSYLMARFSKRMINGQTGDVAGAAQLLGEIAVYLSVLGSLAWQ